MRILDVSPRPTLPPHRGSDTRINAILHRLSRRHQIRQFAQSYPAALAGSIKGDSQITPSWLEHRFSNSLAALISRAPQRGWPRAPLLAGVALHLFRPARLREDIEWADVIMVQFPWQFEYCRRHRRTAALVLATHNIETLKFASWAKSQGLNKDANRGWLRYIRRAETAAVAHADLIVAVSPEDRLGFIRLFGADPDRVIEIPNGADTRTYAPVDLATRAAVKQQLGLPQRPVVSYVAGPSPPNVAGFEWVRRIAMIADRFTFVVVGSVSARAERIGNLVITGRVDEAAQWLRAADISLCPIEYGGGTKIKLLEALAAGLPVVAFEESLHGTALIPGRHLLTAPKNEKGVALALEQLADSPALADNLGDAARAYILQHHDWERITDKLEAALVRLVESSKPSSPAQSLSHSSRTHG